MSGALIWLRASSSEAEHRGPRHARQQQLERHHHGLDQGGAEHAVGDAPHRPRYRIECLRRGLAAQLAQDLSERGAEGVAVRP
jgi:hypothetical protein